MIWRVEIKEKDAVSDAFGDGISKDILDLGITSVSKVRVIQVYLIEGDVNQNAVQKICEELLIDKIIQDYSFNPGNKTLPSLETDHLKIVEIAYNPGVMDPVEESTLKGIRDLGIKSVRSVRTAKKYLLYGNLSRGQIETIVNKVLANKLIQHVVEDPAKVDHLTLDAATQKKFQVVLIDLLKANDKELLRVSTKGQLFLNLKEMRTIQKHFKKLKRN